MWEEQLELEASVPLSCHHTVCLSPVRATSSSCAEAMWAGSGTSVGPSAHRKLLEVLRGQETHAVEDMMHFVARSSSPDFHWCGTLSCLSDHPTLRPADHSALCSFQQRKYSHSVSHRLRAWQRRDPLSEKCVCRLHVTEA